MPRLMLTFNPDQENRGRKGRAGVWRVYQLVSDVAGYLVPVYTSGGEFLFLQSAITYRPGTIVNPRKILQEWLDSRRQ